MLPVSTSPVSFEASPSISKMPPKNSKLLTAIALTCGKGMFRVAKNSVTRLILCSLPQPDWVNCQPQYRRTASRKGDWSLLGKSLNRWYAAWAREKRVVRIVKPRFRMDWDMRDRLARIMYRSHSLGRHSFRVSKSKKVTPAGINI